MSITLKYQNAAEETTGDRTLQGADPVIDDRPAREFGISRETLYQYLRQGAK